jgi:hypothetical protein
VFGDFVEIYGTKVGEKGGKVTELKKLKVNLAIHLYHFLLLLFRESYVGTRYSAPFRLGSVLYMMRAMKGSMMGYWSGEPSVRSSVWNSQLTTKMAKSSRQWGSLNNRRTDRSEPESLLSIWYETLGRWHLHVLFCGHVNI